MDLYNQVSARCARLITKSYSSSFSAATMLLHENIRSDIYNIYALVRVADEIVDTYRGDNARNLLNDYEQNTYRALNSGYSTDIVIHAFQLTARKYGVTKDLLEPFFSSMRTDIDPPKRMSQKEYELYIYGSAEVVGLMCLAVYCADDKKLAENLTPGAKKLGAAFQKVNFLRDLADDSDRLGRHYFPNTSAVLTEQDKKRIVEDIQSDFVEAYQAITQLPQSSKRAVMTAYTYYHELLHKLEKTPIEQIYKQRISVPTAQKIWLTTKALMRGSFVRSGSHG